MFLLRKTKHDIIRTVVKEVLDWMLGRLGILENELGKRFFFQICQLRFFFF